MSTIIVKTLDDQEKPIEIGRITLNANGKVTASHSDSPLFNVVMTEDIDGRKPRTVAWFDKLPTYYSGSRLWCTPPREDGVKKRAGNILAPDPDETEPSIEAKAGVDGKLRLGKAFEMAAKYALAHPEAMLAHGTRTVGEETMKHAWVELGNVVYDGEQGKFYKGSDYRRKMRTTPHAIYKHEDAIGLMKSQLNFGPWNTEGP